MYHIYLTFPQRDERPTYLDNLGKRVQPHSRYSDFSVRRKDGNEFYTYTEAFNMIQAVSCSEGGDEHISELRKHLKKIANYHEEVKLNIMSGINVIGSILFTPNPPH